MNRSVFVATDDNSFVTRESTDDKVTGRGHLASRKGVHNFLI
jgi:hypothetical protein